MRDHAISTSSDVADDEPLRQPDLFERSVSLVQELGGAIDKIGMSGPKLVMRIRVARTARDRAELGAASTELLVALRAATILTDTLVQQVAKAKGERTS